MFVLCNKQDCAYYRSYDFKRNILQMPTWLYVLVRCLLCKHSREYEHDMYIQKDGGD